MMKCKAPDCSREAVEGYEGRCPVCFYAFVERNSPFGTPATDARGHVDTPIGRVEWAHIVELVRRLDPELVRPLERARKARIEEDCRDGALEITLEVPAWDLSALRRSEIERLRRLIMRHIGAKRMRLTLHPVDASGKRLRPIPGGPFWLREGT